MKQLAKISESELIILLQNNDKSGFEYLYDNYSAALYSVICRTITDKETAEDVLQEAFVKIWTNIGKYNIEKGRLFTWMISLTRNLAIDKTRSKGYSHERKNSTSPQAVWSQINKIIVDSINPEHIGLVEMVNKLTHNEREMVELAYYQGYSHSEISDTYNIPLGTVKSRLRSATANLRKIIAD